MDNYQKAAKAIFEADFLLVNTGAGFSADSGLPVYKDIARVEAYEKMGMTYPILCRPNWIKEQPELFYGFWGKCFNDYRKADPHEGYSIINKWKNQFFSENSKVFEEFKKNIKERRPAKQANEIPGPFFVFTSNVDAHHIKSGLGEHEVYECHGNIEKWQCSRGDGCAGGTELWYAPPDFTFEVDPTTMLANNPHKNEKLDYTQNNGFVANHPLCKKCGKLARPAILMFWDFLWVHWDVLWEDWNNTVKKMAYENEKLKVVVLEMGCGKNVPTVRYKSESLLDKVGPAQCTLVRINLDFPNADETRHPIISIQGTSLAAVKQIDEEIKKLVQARAEGKEEAKEEVKEAKEEVKEEVKEEAKEEAKEETKVEKGGNEDLVSAMEAMRVEEGNKA